MAFAATIERGAEKQKDGLNASHPAHRTYPRAFLAHGQLRAAGRRRRGEIVKGDPLVQAGVITSWKMRPLAYWSAQAAKGAR